MITFYNITQGLTAPSREPGSIGIDFRCAEGLCIFPRESGRINLGITWDPEEYEGFLLLLPRSSFFKTFKLIHVGSGVIDPSFRGPRDLIRFEVYNPSHDAKVNVPFDFKICQGVLFPDPLAKFRVNRGCNNKHENRGGFGSTGN